MAHYDVVVVGGGIYGCSVAKHLADQSDLDVCVLEREYRLAAHQSGRNSGTLHPGLVLEFEPDTRLARFALEGMRRTKRYCAENDLPIHDCGLLVVATTDREVERLDGVQRRAEANGITVERLETEAAIREREPNVRGSEALYTPDSATVDTGQIVADLASTAQRAGVDVHLGYEVTGVTAGRTGVAVGTDKGTVTGEYLVNAAGSWALDLAKQMGVGLDYGTVPLRGEYYELVFGQRDLVKTNVYQVGTPDLEGIVDVHFTCRPDGKVIVGPTGSLASGFASYERGRIDVRGLVRTLTSRRFWRFMDSPADWQSAWVEVNRAYRKRAFLEAGRKLVPSLERDDIVRSYTGIGGHLLDEHGNEPHGFVIERGDRSVHLLQVHPGMTAALEAGDEVAGDVVDRVA